MRILIVGFSTRAIAESATRSGEQVLTLDYFGDRDQRAIVENHSLLRDAGLPFSAGALLEASRGLNYDALVYVSNLENYPDIVREMASGRALLGNSPSVLQEVRDWRELRGFCSTAAIPCPTTWLPGEEENAAATLPWLCKPSHSGGGHGIQHWSGARLNETQVLQEYIAGRPASAAFVADGSRSVILGITEQLIGRAELGTGGFTWCGNILPLETTPASWQTLFPAVQAMTDQLTQRFGLRGANGIDLVIAEGADGCPLPYLVEVNPRYTASMELIEWDSGINVFSVHLAALEGRLPEFTLAARPVGRYFGKGIVFALRDSVTPETGDWFTNNRRDIPCSGEEIQSGHPICTVLAQGETHQNCWEGLVRRAQSVQQELLAASGVRPASAGVDADGGRA